MSTAGTIAFFFLLVLAVIIIVFFVLYAIYDHKKWTREQVVLKCVYCGRDSNGKPQCEYCGGPSANQREE